MSSTYVADSTDDKDDSLIIIVNADGTITVDPETLQKLIANQHQGNLSLVRVDNEGNASEEQNDTQDASHVNLTVEGFFPQQQPQPENAASTTAPDIPIEVDPVDPFSQMDPEHLARLESALQSEQAKEILGTNLNENLSDMLDILEGKESPPPVPPPNAPQQSTQETKDAELVEVHNDHSYTSVTPVFHHRSPSPTPKPGLITRPLTRGGRIRGRTGRVMTRGGTRPPVQPQRIMVSTGPAPKTPPKTVVFNQSGQVLTHPTVHPVGEPKVMRKLTQTKLTRPIILSTKTNLAVNTGPNVIVQTNPVLQKKPTILTNRGRTTGRIMTRGGKRPVQSEGKLTLEDKEKPEIEPQIVNWKPKPTEEITPKKVLVTKQPKPKEIKIDSPPKTPKSESPPKSAPSTPTTPKAPAPVKTPPVEAVDESKKKKEKSKAATPAPAIFGPELFSTPDIIRRVSTEKAVVESTPQPLPPPPPPLPENEKSEQESPCTKISSPDKIENCLGDDLTAESILDTIHEEVSKGEVMIDPELLHELANDNDDQMAGLNAIDSRIEETLEKMERGNAESATETPKKSPTPQPTDTNDSNVRIRKLPPIELPTTRSVTKKAAMATNQVQVPTPPKKLTTPEPPSPKEKKQAPVKEKRPSSEGQTSRKSSTEKKVADDSEYDEDEMNSDDSWNSEDDPDRLWCICQKPHNNRFMICCDGCEDWFHGKCVGITKALGQQMEDQGIEWSCPKCREAKAQNQAPKPSSVPGQQTTISSLVCIVCKKPAKASSNYCADVCIKRHVVEMLAALKNETQGLNATTRVVVYEKTSGRLLSGEKAPNVQGLTDWLISHPTFEVVRPSILPTNKYYTKSSNSVPKVSEKPLKQTTLTTKFSQSGVKVGFAVKPPVTVKSRSAQLTQPHTAKPLLEKKNEMPKKKPAPTPTVEKKKEPEKKKEVEKSEAKPKKKEAKKESEPAPKQIVKQSDPKPSSEPIRANVRRTLQTLLSQRVAQDPELNTPSSEIKTLVESIETELFSFFEGAGAKYKLKYRSLLFNIKDPKNLTLYRKIVDKAVSPSQLVRLSSDELASQELAQWREKEAKHQIEIIKKNELELIHQAKTVVLKSRKGEEVIETKNHDVNISELESVLNRTADDIDDIKPEVKEEVEDTKRPEKEKDRKKERRDREKERRRDRKRSHRSRSRSKDRSSRSKDRSGKKSRRSRSRSRDRRKPDKSSEAKVKIEPKDELKSDIKPVVKVEPPEKRLTPPPLPPPLPVDPPPEPPREEDLSDREPSSTVTINTPTYAEESKPVWNGSLNMTEVSKFTVSAFEVSGSCEGLEMELTETLDCVGRIQPDAVWDYVSRMKKAGTKDIIVIRFQPDPETQKVSYLSLYSYLSSRNRMGVIGSTSKAVKDFYVLPLASHSPIPQVLLPLDGPGFDDYRPHLLLGIIIRSRKGSVIHSLPVNRKRKVEVMVKSSSERSYTPPLPDGNGSSTPPLPSSLTVPPLPSISSDLEIDGADEPYSPGDGEPYSPEEHGPPPPNPDLQKNIDEVNRMIEEKRQKIESMTVGLPAIPGLGDTPPQFSGKLDVDNDDDAAYSPPESFTPPHNSDSSIPFFDSKALPDIKLPSNLQQILASIKGPSVMDVKSDPIVRAYTSQKSQHDEDLESLSEEEKVEKEPPVEKRRNRDPRQRPAKKSALSQLSDADLMRKVAEMEAAGVVRPADVPSIPPPVVDPAAPYYRSLPPAFQPPPSYSSALPLPPNQPPTRPIPPDLPDRSRGWSHHGPPPPLRHSPGGGPPPPPFHGRFRGRYDHAGSVGVGAVGPAIVPVVAGPSAGPSRGPPGPPPPGPPGFNNVQSQWDEEIRNFELTRKGRDSDRRKRRGTRSPSPDHRRRRSRRSSSLTSS